MFQLFGEQNMKYETIDELIDAEGNDDACYDCPHYREWEESHPYGEGSASETLWECLATDPKECRRMS
jgi:hypothetical protein